MTLLGDALTAAKPVHFIKDYVGLDYHNDGHTHIDALCHVAYRAVSERLVRPFALSHSESRAEELW